MKIYETVVVPEKTDERFVGLGCDMCGATTDATDEDWPSEKYNTNEVEVSHQFGNSYPECGEGTKNSVHLCPRCFNDKLIPWLEDQGCAVTREEWDW